MYCRVAGFLSRASIASAMLVWACCACGGESGDGVSVGAAPDGAVSEGDASRMDEDVDPLAVGCDVVEVDGSMVVERERDFTATFHVGEPYTKTVMLFGGERLEEENLIGNAYILGLDKEDAQMLAQEYPDFYLCSSAGGMAAADHILPYDLVPASC